MAEAEGPISAQLMAAVQPDGTWQPVVDAIRTSFHVERATFYPLLGNRLSGGVCSAASGVECAPKPSEPLEVIGVLRDVVYRKRTIHVAGEEDRYLLAGWPNPCGIRTLLGLPVVCTEGQVRGLLELANRIPSPDHPHQAFDSYERRTAEEVARSLGNADTIRAKQLESGELRSKLETATRIGAASLAGGLIMHRLMTPFALIQSSVDWLRLHPSEPPDDRQGHLDRIQASCSEAVAMIQRASQRGTFEKRPEKVRTLVKQALRAVYPDVSASSVRLNVVNDLTVPVLGEPYSIVAALINLLANALDAMGGCGDLSVATELASDQRHAVIRIRNTGAVVKPELIEEFFRPGHTTKDRELHLGFGLPIARRAIEDADGVLEMTPLAEGGMEARVVLPVAQSKGSQAISQGDNL
jgi:two-component system C4-dicarboxylate transport sensor histidine kinase DctB